MRVVIVGQKWLGAEVLKLCLRRGDTLLKVITPPADASGEYDRLYAVARQLDIPTEICGRRVARESIPAGADLIVAAHAHAFISGGARDATRLGALGYHPPLLPRHRGRDAVRWTIHMGDALAGGTVFWMDDGADTGPISAQDWCHVRPNDDPRSLWRRELGPIGVRLFANVLASLDRGERISLPQDETCATWEPAFSGGKLAAE